MICIGPIGYNVSILHQNYDNPSLTIGQYWRPNGRVQQITYANPLLLVVPNTSKYVC